MQVIRTILWVLVTAALVAFIAMNWTRVPVNLWPVDGGNYVHFEWPVGIIALVFFVLGAVPLWLVHRASQWRLKRRIHALENTIATTSAPAPAPSPAPALTTEPAVPTIPTEPDNRPATIAPAPGTNI